MRYGTITEKSGFTLIELIVVMALIGIVMFAALPRFQRVITDPARIVSQWIIWKIPELKQRAVSENRRYALQIDLSENKLWTTHEAMSEAEKVQAAESGYVLPHSISVSNIEFPDDRVISTGVAQILFYSKGYSDRAIIHLSSGDDRTFSYVIEPFLNKIGFFDTHVGFTEP
ncbi:MAG: type II secretion system protein [Desulfobacterales bacterium]|jgi:prepilin-type N-terminal cleavage/methylation domain-containing protein|nr:type II secretion system protein [Desulfobacterales bacterium]